MIEYTLRACITNDHISRSGMEKAVKNKMRL